ESDAHGLLLPASGPATLLRFRRLRWWRRTGARDRGSQLVVEGGAQVERLRNASEGVPAARGELELCGAALAGGGSLQAARHVVARPGQRPVGPHETLGPGPDVQRTTLV